MLNRFSSIVPCVALLFITSIATRTAHAQVTSDVPYFEIDGDFGSTLSEVFGDTPPYIQADDVTDGGHTSWGRRQTPQCSNWAHTSASPYMGSNAYTASAFGYGPQRRTEQMLLSDWCPEAAAAGDRDRYFSLAFRLVDLPVNPVVGTRGFIAQLHQGGNDPIPFRIQWEYLCPPTGCGYFLTMGTRDANNQFYEFGPPIPGTVRKGIPVALGTWTRMLFWFYAPGAAQSEARVWLMDNPSGLWVEVGHDSGHSIGVSTLGCTNNFAWKVGIYSNDNDDIVVDYDNVAYGRLWNDITKNRLIGHAKGVLGLRLSGNTLDYSWLLNGAAAPGDPVTDYNNDATLMNPSGAQWGAGFISLINSAWVKTNMDLVDFDFGNYATVSVWLRTTDMTAGTKGIVMLNETPASSKLFLAASTGQLMFGVRHTNGATSTVSVPLTATPSDSFPWLADNQWHHVAGVFNRFAPDGNRVRLYVDYNVDGVSDQDEGPYQIVGSDLPMQRGASSEYLAIGKYSTSGYFKGDVEDVSIFNYPMTSREIRARTITTHP